MCELRPAPLPPQTANLMGSRAARRWGALFSACAPPGTVPRRAFWEERQHFPAWCGSHIHTHTPDSHRDNLEVMWAPRLCAVLVEISAGGTLGAGIGAELLQPGLCLPSNCCRQQLCASGGATRLLFILKSSLKHFNSSLSLDNRLICLHESFSLCPGH